METIKGNPLGPRVISVEPLDDFILRVTFTNNEKRLFDAKKIYNLPCFAPLKQKAFFDKVRVEYGSVAWGQDIDYCPDTLYDESTPYA